MADNLGNAEQNIKIELASESAVYDVLFDMLDQGVRSRWVRQKGNKQTLDIDNLVVEVVNSNVAGMLDLNTINDQLLMNLWAKLPPNLVHVTALDILSKRQQARFSSYSDLVLRLKTTQSQFECLYPFVTLFSGKSEPDFTLMSEKLQKRLGRVEKEKLTVMGGESMAVIGEVFRINIKTQSAPTRTNYLSVEVLLTGRSDFPYLIRSWNWFQHCEN